MLRYFCSYDVRVTYVWRIEAAPNMRRFLKKFAAPLRTLANEAIVQRDSIVSFSRCFGVAVVFFAIPDTLYVRKPIRKCVGVALCYVYEHAQIDLLCTPS